MKERNISLSKKSEIVIIKDIREVATEPDDQIQGMNIFEGEIVSIMVYESYRKCKTCFNGQILEKTSTVGRCKKFNASVKLASCIVKSIKKVMPQAIDETKQWATMTGNDIIMKAAEVENMEDIEEAMLNSRRAIQGNEVTDVKRLN
jgi:hypothetical protein